MARGVIPGATDERASLGGCHPLMDSDAVINRRAGWLFGAVLVGGGLVATVWYWLAQGRYTTYQIDTHDPVSGLIVDSPVEFHGVEVGKVKRVELVDPRSIRVLLAVSDDAPISRATVATITARGLATRGFTGYVYVSLEDLGTGSGRLAASPGAKYPVIPTRPTRIVNLDVAIAQVNDNVQSMTDILQTVLDAKTVVSLKQSIESLQRVTKAMSDNTARMESIIASAEKTGRQLEPLVESSKQTVKVLQTQVLPEAYKAMANLDDLSTTLNGVATKISRDPSVIIRGTGPQALGPGETK